MSFIWLYILKINKKVIEENKELQALRNAESTLIAWFKLNKIDKFAKNIKYVEIPRYYRFTNSKLWKRRERNQQFDAIGRLNIVSPVTWIFHAP